MKASTNLLLILFGLVGAGCVNVTLVDAATMAVSSACDGLTDRECVDAVAEGICEGTDSVKECLTRYAKARP